MKELLQRCYKEFGRYTRYWKISLHIILSIMQSNTFPHFATDALHKGQDPELWESRAVIPPISLSTTFKQYTPGVPYSVSLSYGSKLPMFHGLAIGRFQSVISI